MDTESLLKLLNAHNVRYKKLLIRQYILETDIHPFVAGVTFEEVWQNRVEDYIGQTPAQFAGLDERGYVSMELCSGD